MMNSDFGIPFSILDLSPIVLGATAADAFQNSAQPRLLIIQLAVGSTAITLTRSSRVVIAEQSWVPADIAQAAKRCHRIGQPSSVNCSVISLANSIDESMYVALVPNRHSPPAYLLREGYREDGKVKSRTLANLSHWPLAKIAAP